MVIANYWRRYATYLTRQIRAVPERSRDDGTRLGDLGLAQARAGVTALAARAAKGRRSGPIGGGGWSVATATVRQRACARVWSAARAVGPGLVLGRACAGRSPGAHARARAVGQG